MSPLRFAVLLATLLLTTVSACSTPTAPPRTLQAYSGQAELDAALERWRQAYERLPRPLLGRRSLSPSSPPAPHATAAPAMQSAQSESAKSAAPSAPAPTAIGAADSITNVQTVGVDEGGIVKHAGDHLVILRRGRLFTVKVGGDELHPVATIDAYAPGADPRGAWYDELLIHGQTVVVVGYSYARGGTEIGLFDLGRNGNLVYRATYHLRSNDYYSSRNYASRLIGSQLVFYTPSVLQPWQSQQAASWLPAMRRWHATVPEEFQRILPATRIHRSDDEFDPRQALALHTVTRCELAAVPLRCESSAVLGPAGRVFYVSQGSVYVWTATRRPWGPLVPTAPGAATEGLPVPDAAAAAQRPTPAQSLASLFRLPLDGSAPSGIKAVGMPVDQMSFLEDGAVLNVLLRDEGTGEGMWGAERGAARMALLRLPLSALGDGHTAAARENYRRLPGGAAWPLQNRHIGDWLVWSGGEQAWALRPALRDQPTPLAPGHRVERIEALGRDAVLVGSSGGDLRFSALRLDRQAALAGSFFRPGARQAETRTHGFFYRPLAADEGLLGLPILGQADGTRQALPRDARATASVVFLRQRQLQFTGLGELAASPRETPLADGCKASCVDWYGNARPIFLGQRVFALMGYELVEGNVRADGLGERRRVDFAPSAPSARDGRPSPFQ